MAAQVGRKRNRDLDQDCRVTKKAKLFIPTSICSLPDEILLQILAVVPKKYLAAISEVSHKWLRITNTRDFWKLFCRQKWPNMVASDDLNFKIIDYILPASNGRNKSVIKCYGRFAYHWAKIATPEERQQIIEALLNAISYEYRFGQNDVPSSLLEANDGGPENYPQTWNELQKENNDIERLDCISTLPRAPYYMSRVHIKPFNSVTHYSIRHFQTVQNYITQLLKIIKYPPFKGMYVCHAQDVLHAVLATFRWHLDSSMKCFAIIDLMPYVKEEMEPSDLSRYIGIILYRLLEKLQYSSFLLYDEKLKQGIAELFHYCLKVLNEIPELANVYIITKAINICLKIEKFSIPRVAPLGELVFYFITQWPRYTHSAIKESKLGPWLIKRITEEAKSPEELTPLLMVFTFTGVLYGIDYVLEALCVDPVIHKYNSRESYLDMIIPHCQVLYKAVRRGKIKLSPLRHNYLRKFLILNAIYCVDRYAGGIAAIPKQGRDNIGRLQDAIADDKLDTGVPKLNKLVKRLDLAGICKELFVQPAEHEEEYEMSDEDYDDMFIRV